MSPDEWSDEAPVAVASWIDQVANNPAVFWTAWTLVMGGSLCALCVVLLRPNRRSEQDGEPSDAD